MSNDRAQALAKMGQIVMSLVSWQVTNSAAGFTENTQGGDLIAAALKDAEEVTALIRKMTQ